MSSNNFSIPVLLGLDTSGPRLQLALRAGQITHQFVQDIAKGHAEILFDCLAQFLADNGLTYSKITKIITTTGPGSFTGLRIGIAAARGLGLARQVPVLGIPNLLALSLEETKTNFAIVVDARRGQFYAQHFKSAGVALSDPELIDQKIFDTDYALTCASIITDPKVNMGTLMKFCENLDAKEYPPTPTYVREADAKPQTKLRIARHE